MQEIRFRISIPTDEYIKYYQGAAKSVYTVSEDGRSIHFPANILQRFLMHDGIHGYFALQYDDNGKFSSIRRIADKEV
ncbi:MAG: DUF2835 domain-containing protein [Gammaproteobacteria bacterium]|nr:DUF2835 domain-containing protein [Gammaproteobacteria bacterium]MDH5593609.1 DUF2835 domain-containing protein [Gammaproteobacteria bacterium]MDH5613598.1 DUF2835 domain-containing protein [Gammaproteobacteria bacterium]